MKNADISVLMTTYINDDSEHFKVAFNSILEQTCLPSQIVIVLDGEVNNQVISYLEHQQSNALNIDIDILALEQNVGLSMALNKGLEICKCAYIARMDSDDFSRQDRFQKQLDYMLSNPSVDMCGTYYEQYDGNLKNRLSMREVPLHGTELNKYAKLRTPINHVTIMFKRSVYLAGIKYPETRDPFEDWWFALYFIKGNYVIHNLPFSSVMVRGGEAFTSRRNGWNYAIVEQKNISMMYQLGLMTLRDRFINFVIRFPIRLMPSNLLERFYNTMLREKAQ